MLARSTHITYFETEGASSAFIMRPLSRFLVTPVGPQERSLSSRYAAKSKSTPNARTPHTSNAGRSSEPSLSAPFRGRAPDKESQPGGRHVLRCEVAPGRD